MNLSKIPTLFVYPEKCWHEFTFSRSHRLICEHCKKVYPDARGNPNLAEWPDFGPWLEDFLKNWENWKHFSSYIVPDIPWLFLSPVHFITLVSKWLSLPETQEKFGWIRDACTDRLNCDDCNDRNICDGAGNKKAPWLLAWEESK